MANGFNVAVEGHPILLTNPSTISGGATAQAFSMKAAEHASIGIFFGAEGGSPPVLPTNINVLQCTNAAGANATAMPNGFRYYYQTTPGAGNDILNGNQQALANTPSQPPNYTTGAGGITAFPAGLGGIQLWIEIDSAELEAIADVVGPVVEYPYLQVQITNGAYTTYACVMVVLSGLRYSYNIGASQTV